MDRRFSSLLASLALRLWSEPYLSLNSQETGFKEGSSVPLELCWVHLKIVAARKGTYLKATGGFFQSHSPSVAQPMIGFLTQVPSMYIIPPGNPHASNIHSLECPSVHTGIP